MKEGKNRMSEVKETQFKGKRFLSLRVKLLLGFTLAFTIVFAAAYYWFYSFAVGQALSQIETDLKTTLEAAASGVDGDELHALYTDGSADPRCAIPTSGDDEMGYYPDDERFQRHVNWLLTVHTIEPRAFLYTYIRGERPSEMIFISSHGAALDPPEGAPFCFRYIAGDPGPPYAGLERYTADMVGYTDDFGRWVSGYMPIKDSDGEVVAAIGADFQAEYIEQVKRDILSGMWIPFIIIYLSLFIVVYLVSGILTRPIMAFASVAERIGEGDYDQDLSGLMKGNFPDEIDTLAHVLSIMVSKVYQREQTLRRRVEELQIMVDRQKQEQQVSEIVESDFFQDLQSKAKRIKDRGRGDAPPQEDGESKS